MKKVLRRVGFGALVIFALIGMAFSGVFAAMQLGLLNVRGSASDRNQFFTQLSKADIAAASLPKQPTKASCVKQNDKGELEATCPWNTSQEWEVVRAGLTKDASVINDVAAKTGVDSRMIAAAISPEQLRFFSSNRETFKQYFEPLKVLGSMSQFSLGIAGFKQETAKRVEQYTVDKNSPFYAGDGMSQLIAYSGGSGSSKQLYNRLTDPKNHYYSYMYTALYIKEIEHQWAQQGYDITERPDVLVTLFNVGFDDSKPKANPQIGGSPVTLNKVTYNFGELGTNFYLSDELTALFPRD